MRRISIVLVMLAAAPFYAQSAELQALDSRVESVSLFKNGLGVVKRTVEVPGAGTYRVDDVPEPVHGTFLIESDAKVEARVTTQEVEVPLRARKGPVNLQDELAGHAVTLYFREDNIPPVDGTVLELDPATGEDAWSRSYQQNRYAYYNSTVTPQLLGQYLILETARRRIYVDSTLIAYADVKDAKETVTERRPVLLLTVEGEMDSPKTVSISYLTKGIAWAPSYRVDISNPETLNIEQKAILKNELGDMEAVEVNLISGFPSIAFSHVTSPFSLNTTWANFFQQLNQDPQANCGGSQVLTQNAVVYNNLRASDSGVAPSESPSGEGPDVHYQPIGKRTLKEGDSLALSVADGRAEYERIVEWIVPDTRRADGRYIQDYERNQHPEKYEDSAWDALRFKNPLPFPMTTGAAMITSNGRFQGEQTSYWVNQGEETTLHITKALSVRTRHVEHEVPGEREVVYVGGDDYQKTQVAGELNITNYRNEKVTLVVRRRFSGELISADETPECTLREEGAWCVNKRNELTWTLTLEAGEEKMLAYTYSLLVNR